MQEVQWAQGLSKREVDALRDLVDGVAFLCVTAWQMHVMAERIRARQKVQDPGAN